MSQTKFSSEEQDLAREAGNLYDNARNFASEDARLGLKYMLLRLSLLGLSDHDQKQLRKLARLVFADADGAQEEAGQEAERIRSRKTASPLAVAITNIVSSASEKKMAMLGTVFGAYAGLGRNNITSGILGAVGGGVACSTNDLLQQHLEMKRFLEAE